MCMRACYDQRERKSIRRTAGTCVLCSCQVAVLDIVASAAPSTTSHEQAGDHAIRHVFGPCKMASKCGGLRCQAGSDVESGLGIWTAPVSMVQKASIHRRTDSLPTILVGAVLAATLVSFLTAISKGPSHLAASPCAASGTIPAKNCSPDFGIAATIATPGEKTRRPWMFRVLSQQHSAYREVVYRFRTDNRIAVT